MMRVLVLDDEQYRHDGFAKKYAGHDVWHVRTASDAIKHLARCCDESRFDVVCLDHDLGKDEAGDGRQVARYIAEMPCAYRPREVIVHSWNMPAGAQMMAVLAGTVERLRREPFQWPGDDEAGCREPYKDED